MCLVHGPLGDRVSVQYGLISIVQGPRDPGSRTNQMIPQSDKKKDSESSEGGSSSDYSQGQPNKNLHRKWLCPRTTDYVQIAMQYV